MNTIEKEKAKALVAEFVRRGQVRFPTPSGDRLISTPEDLELAREIAQELRERSKESNQ